MYRTVDNWANFNDAWHGVANFLMAGECADCFDFELPPFDELLDTVHRHEDAHVFPGAKADPRHALEMTDEFRALPLEKAIRYEFTMAHYNIHKWDAPGQMLEGLNARVMQPFKDALSAQGFEWNRFSQYFFFAGPNCATNYHMDKSNVIAWQRYGTEVFCGIKDPDRWKPLENRMRGPAGDMHKPAEIIDDDVLTYEMKRGDVPWNPLLTPHWVEATNEPALSLNISLRGLRRHGKLGRHEQEFVVWQKVQEQPAGADSSPY